MFLHMAILVDYGQKSIKFQESYLEFTTSELLFLVIMCHFFDSYQTSSGMIIGVLFDISEVTVDEFGDSS